MKLVYVAEAMVALLVAGCTAAPPGVAGTTPLPTVDTTENQDSTTTPDEGSRSAEQDRVFEGSSREYFELLAVCLEEAGFIVSVSSSGDGVYAPDVSGTQRDDLLEASKTCRERLGTLPIADLTDPAVVRTFYAALKETRSCLIELGYDIAEPPTFEVFQESLSTGPWHPYHSLPAEMGPSEWDMIQEACPQP
ncbi:MAG: hypothetical protein JJE16_15735 [Nitrospiraceae bacterium]|nr:hypothetical protein [Nitrospiraceae bacterium]